jgi:hypothetical protein
MLSITEKEGGQLRSRPERQNLPCPPLKEAYIKDHVTTVLTAELTDLRPKSGQRGRRKANREAG